MRKVFDETRINGMTLANRLVRSATWEGMCEEDGRPTPIEGSYDVEAVPHESAVGEWIAGIVLLLSALSIVVLRMIRG